MSGDDRQKLRDLLVSRYATLRATLARRLGSDALAQEALQDTWLHLQNGTQLAVRQPGAYLLRMAINAGLDRQRATARLATRAELDALLHGQPDLSADATRVIAAKEELASLEKAIASLTPRRRDILLAARLNGETLKQIAARLGVSQRLVELELKSAVQHCADQLGRPLVQRFGPKSGGAS